MNTNLNNQYNDKDELRQALLELHYDLLDEAEATVLRAAIDSDADVAAEWANTLKLASDIADAARMPVNSEPTAHGIARPGVETRGNEPEGLRPTATGKSSVWLTPTLVAGLAALFALFMIGWWHLSELPAKPMAAVRIEAEVIDQANASNEFLIKTTRMDGSGLSVGGFQVTPAMLSFSVLAQNVTLFSGVAETDHLGMGKIVLPSDLVIPREAELRVEATSANGERSESSVVVPLEPTRCLTYLTVDRPVYRPGETVYFRSLTLERASFQPKVDVPIRYELIDPSGAAVAGMFSEGLTERAVGNGAFTIPKTAPGGSYTLVAKSLDGFFPDERREFQVRAYRVPRFKKELEFRRRSYGPGDTVEADFKAERAEGGMLANVSVAVVAKVDNEVIHEQAAETTAAGTYAISFKLPTNIRKGAGQLAVVIDDGGTQETKVKTIPIQLGRVDVEFFPEGGYLVDGLRNRVYFVARNSLGEPIDIKGEVQSRDGRQVATLQTTRDGMGRFELVPKRGERYSLRVSSPIDVHNTIRLPAVVKELPVIDTGVGVFAAGEPITMQVRSTVDRNALVRVVCRGQLVSEQIVKLKPGTNPMSIPVGKKANGVVRVTILDSDKTPALPLVERLVFCRQERQLQVEIVESAEGLDRSPGESTRLTLQVRDETGEPTPAVLGVAVVDDAALRMDDTERPNLRTHFLLTSEIQKPEDLEHANFYMSDSDEAAEAVDLLLGTQGWRRFVSGSADQPNVDYREQLVRLLQLDGDPLAATPTSYQTNGRQVQQWNRYREAAQSAWRLILFQTRILMAMIVLLWMISIAVRMRRSSSARLAGLLLLAATSLFLYGCGAQQYSERASVAADTGSVEESAAQESAPPMAMEPEEMFMDEMAMDGMKEMEKVKPAVESPAQKGLVKSTRDERNKNAVGNREFDDGGFGGKYRGSDQSRMMFETDTLTADDLKRLLASRGLDADSLASQLLDELRFPVRQYAHRHVVGDPEVREDFAETLYWQPLLITDSEGRASIRFDLSDSVTTFRVNVDAHATSGRIGSYGGAVTSRLPFQMEPKMPLEVTTGDRIDLPVAVVNATKAEMQVGMSINADSALQPLGETTRTLSLAPGQRRRELMSLNVLAGSAEQDASVEIRGSTESMQDSIRRTLHIAPAGYPVDVSIAGRLSDQASVPLLIPADFVDGSLAVAVRAYPSPVADAMAGIDSILREPHGCFEQTSATNYPNTMALLYMQKSDSTNPEVAQRAMGMLERGYGKLISFECEKRGYEWFGNDPGHEALSAFGLMQFNDMTKVMDVSEEMITRTRVWLMGRRDGKGGFKRNPRHLHVWSVQQHIVNAYVLWALSEADVAAGQSRRTANELKAELDQLASVANSSNDPYLISLSAATLMNVNRNTEGRKLLDRLTQLQHEDGHLEGATTVVSSGGLSRKMETTALAVLAWSKAAKYASNADGAAAWIRANRTGNGGFGSTQATVLALKALITHANHQDVSSAGAILKVMLDGNVIGQTQIPQDIRSGSAVEIAGLGQSIAAKLAESDSVELTLQADGVNNLSYTVDVSYNATTPESDDQCPVKVTAELSGKFDADGNVAAGDSLTVKASLFNTTGEGQPMTVAIIGLPGGLEPQIEQLDELKKAGRFDYYELNGREVIFYWRTIEPNSVKDIEFGVTAAIPGKYTGPASRAYLYYTAEQKQWTKPMVVEIR
ncbi:MG2 domain-containing protein [Novipirellula caenicola]|uniref:Alpha-2-macroglobulin domain-containing protein n=1 Tax=Novipirellula caenicola TaxID=1536901 RepID=A0ABP9VJH7_9BACT